MVIKMPKCVFCEIIAGRQKATIVYEDEQVLGFMDYRPIRIGHTLVIPKTHYETILDIPDDELTHIILVTRKLAGHVKKQMKAAGLRVSANNGPLANQVVPHLHFHIIPAYEDAPFKIHFERIPMTDGELEEIAKKIRLT